MAKSRSAWAFSPAAASFLASGRAWREYRQPSISPTGVLGTLLQWGLNALADRLTHTRNRKKEERLLDGTLLMTCHWLARDVFNPSRQTHSKILRSTDEGESWTEIRIGPDGFPDGAQTVADWTAFQNPDGGRPGKLVTYLGVSIAAR